MSLSAKDLRGPSRSKEVNLGHAKVVVRPLTAAEVDELEQAHVRPQPPLIPHPTKPGRAGEADELVPNHFEPLYQQAMDKYRSRLQYAQFAAATGCETEDGTTFEQARKGDGVTGLDVWMTKIAKELGSAVTWDQVTVVLNTIRELSGVGDVKGLQDAVKNSSAPPQS